MRSQTLLCVAGVCAWCVCHSRASVFIVVNTNDSGLGSLRQAMLDANALPSLDYIWFNIPGAGPHTISPASPLPAISNSVVIDGYTQPGAKRNTSPSVCNAELKVELSGSNAGNSAGLSIGGSAIGGTSGMIIVYP